MSNKMIDIIKNVFEDLKSNITEDYYISSILDIKRMINPNPEFGDKISDILQFSKYKIYNMTKMIKCMVFFYENNYYMLYPYDLQLTNDWKYASEEYFVEGFGLIAISNSFLIPHKNKSYEIYNNIFGSSMSKFDYCDIVCFYQDYTIVKSDIALNELVYTDDIYRITGLFISKNIKYTNTILSKKTYDNIFLLLNLKSSRCISSCIIRCLDSSLLDHCFLELYRCLEFLFYLQISFNIKEKYDDTDLNSIINLVANREIIKREQDTLEAVIKNIDSSCSIENFIEFMEKHNYIDSSQTTNKCNAIATHIYDLRCRTAHLSYLHKYIPTDYNWELLIENLSNLIYNIYNKLDSQIINICDENRIWNEINI